MGLSEDIDNYIKEKHYKQINSVLVYNDGKITAERYYNGYDEKSRNVIRSIVKSIISISAGICLDKGILKSLETPIYHYLPEFGKNLDPLHKAITIRHLLTMTSGIYWVGGVHYHCPLLTGLHRSENWITYIANIAVVDRPGTKYRYSEFDVILLTAVLERAIGSDYFNFLNEMFFRPLGIESGRWWRRDGGEYYSVGFGGAGNGGIEEQPSRLTARELLLIGQLFLNKGMHEGKRIVSEQYVREAVTPLKCNPGYGYLWWVGDNWFGCRGFGGQNITVKPKERTIYVIQATPTARGMEYEDVIERELKL